MENIKIENKFKIIRSLKNIILIRQLKKSHAHLDESDLVADIRQSTKLKRNVTFTHAYNTELWKEVYAAIIYN